MKIMTTGLLCLALCALATPASAQMTWTDKGFFNLDVGFQSGTGDFTVTTPFELYGETGSVASTQNIGGGGFFNISGGYKVWRNLAVGIGFTFTGSSTDANVTAEVPDDLVTDNLRTVNTTASDVSHSELQIHFTGTWMIPVTDKIDVGLNFGPTFFNVSQEVPNGVNVTEPGPTINSVSVEELDESAIGIHFGVDVNYMVNKRFGAGGMIRYVWGSSDVENAGDKLSLGGFQIGGGLRVRF